ncbi:uncharacterized protein LOC110913822 [Helianthus annuus]|uniref:uncharacterized protein LOC110913822 n=1 Tax=Helianthus annuus TaxID=4232 RepID=UPI000B905F4E|nr:uncharacterized protein LOC110913822 [Helianthus annuus]
MSSVQQAWSCCKGLQESASSESEPAASASPTKSTPAAATTRCQRLDLNAGVDENIVGHATADGGAAPPSQPPPPPAVEPSEVTNSEYPGWSVSEINKMAIDRCLARVDSRLDEDDEDYDEE